MTETQVGFLYNAATALKKSENRSLNLLRSYYLMRCKEVTKGFGLPERHFSNKVRCPKCCIEWANGVDVHVRPLKLSKKQRRRIRSSTAIKINNEIINRKELLKCNEMEQVCKNCKSSTVIPVPKPAKIKHISREGSSQPAIEQKKILTVAKKVETTKSKKDAPVKPEINVYSATKEIFSLNNKSNNITNEKEPKIIKNNKKKKDKFAGLCQKAVLATAKLKDMKEKQNKLNLFLKPSK